MASRSEKKTTTTVLLARRTEQALVQLAGEDHLDEALLDKAVAEINRIYVSKGLETARAIGNYVVNAFFGGDLESFRQREKKHVTFRALADREELHVAYNTIWSSEAREQWEWIKKLDRPVDAVAKGPWLSVVEGGG